MNKLDLYSARLSRRRGLKAQSYCIAFFIIIANCIENMLMINFIGDSGPVVFMTDDSAAERAAISDVYPLSNRLLCTFHVLQSVQRWLKKKVNKQVIDECYELFRSLVYCSSPTQFMDMWACARYYRSERCWLIFTFWLPCYRETFLSPFINMLFLATTMLPEFGLFIQHSKCI